MPQITTQEMLDKLLKTIPPWFADSNPDLDALLTGAAYVFQVIYNDLVYAKKQTRIKTATDIFLDFISQDFFGDRFKRCEGESDHHFRDRILNELLKPKVTRQAMIDALVRLTGRTPIIFEGWRDGGYWNHAYAGHMTAGFNNRPYEAWITAYRPLQPVINTSAYTNHTLYGTAQSYWGASSDEGDCVTDADIIRTIEETKLAGTLMHITILD